MDLKPQQKTRVLFFAWGDSIHARRRIGIFTEDPAFEVGVISTFAYDFPNAENFYLKKSGRVGHSTPVLSFLLRGARAVLGGALYLLLKIRDREAVFSECCSLLADAALVRKYARQFRPDLVFLQTMLYPCYLACLLPARIPLMITFWNGDVTWWANWDGVERLLKKHIVTWGVRRARAVTVNSEAAYVACLGYGAAAGRLHLLRYPGVDLARFHPGDRQAARQRLGIGRGPVVFAPRGLGGYLNSDVVLEAAALVAREFPQVLFVISCAVAAPGELEKHAGMARTLGIADNCRWVPKIAWEEMPDCYRAADLMLSLSSHDSLPNCMLEAMACGVPAVMGDIEQLHQWVVDGANGYLVPTRDPQAVARRIVAVLRDADGELGPLTRNALDLVAEKVDSSKNIPLVKQLVRDTARGEREAP